ncbi:hypothetical protein ACTRXD_15265 [Nitrospira sp. T9]|uniref:hypothetical protein n=1 Tax=unclassified Nitrospira TaxID=2652172 RepID=UPI003F98DC2C
MRIRLNIVQPPAVAERAAPIDGPQARHSAADSIIARNSRLVPHTFDRCVSGVVFDDDPLLRPATYLVSSNSADIQDANPAKGD